jgi:hypothetical protein
VWHDKRTNPSPSRTRLTLATLGLRRTLEETHERIVDSASRTAATEVLLANKAGFIEAEHDGEKTYRLKQSAVKPLVDLNTQRKCINLSLTAFGPYTCNYSRYVCSWGRYIWHGYTHHFHFTISRIRHKERCHMV